MTCMMEIMSIAYRRACVGARVPAGLRVSCRTVSTFRVCIPI